MVSTSLQALKRLTETISSLRPDPDGEEAGSTPQDGVGAVIGAGKRRDGAIAAQPDEAGAQQLIWQLGQQLGTKLCLGKEKGGASKFFKNVLTMASTENSSPCKN